MKQKRTNEQGIVAIIVSMMLMIVLSIIIISFARISRRESQDAADRALSTQAFYAAESGVNFAKSKLIQDYTLYSTYSLTSGCGDFMSSLGATGEVGAADSNSKFTCLLVDTSVPSIIIQQTTSQVVFPFDTGGGTHGMKIDWDDGDGATSYSCSISPASNPDTASCGAPVLRVEITNPTFSSTGTQVIFVYPDSSASSAPTFSPSNTGIQQSGACSNISPYNCTATINGIPDGSYVRIIPIYGSMAMAISEKLGNDLKGAQAIIDATGKAADVLRRIQVRVPIGNMIKDAPRYTAEATNSICKHFTIDGVNQVEDRITTPSSPPCWASSTIPD